MNPEYVRTRCVERICFLGRMRFHFQSFFIAGQEMLGDYMEIVRIINNNVVSSRDDKGREVVVMGKGVAVGEEMITLLV